MLPRKYVCIAGPLCLLAALCTGAEAGGKEAFVDYYATASTLISTLNGVAADLERMNLQSGDFPDDVARDMKSRLVKMREGFDSILTYDDRTNDINEGYILYVDKMLLALMVAQEYRDEGGAERRENLTKLLAESAELRAELNRKVQRDKKTYGID
jgi:hypothetical protein